MSMLFLLMLTAAQATPATAPQTQPADQTSATVVVTGRRPDQDKALRHMTSAITPVADAGQPLARFQTPICPQVDGLTPALNKAFADRIRADAKIAGLEADGATCSPNLTVLIVPDGQAVVRELHRTRSAVFGALNPITISHLAAPPGPAHLWTSTEVRSRAGARIKGGSGGDDVGVLNVRNASILQAVTRTDVNGTVLLLDQPATVGKTINQLADYAAMRTIAQTRPIGTAAAEPTILKLLDADEADPARGLTAFDTAYLKALYHGSAEYRPLTQVGIMNRSIRKDLSRPAADQPRGTSAK